MCVATSRIALIRVGHGPAGSEPRRVMLVLSDFSVRDGGRVIVHPLSVTFPPGVTAVLGLNGSGKTTLLRGLLGETSGRQGDIRWGGNKAPHVKDVGWMPQNGSFPSRMRVGEVLHYAAWLKDGRYPESWLSEAAHTAGIGAVLDRPVGTLSGGEMRRLLFAVSSISSPGLMLLDEPTAALDLEQRHGLLEAVGRVSADCVVVMTTHILQDVSQVADRVVVLHEGRLRYCGTMVDFRRRGSGADDIQTLTAAFRAVVAE